MLENKRRRLETSIVEYPLNPFTEEELDYLYWYTGYVLELTEELNIRSKSMSVVQSAVLFAAKDQTPPKEVIEALLETCDSASGLAVALDGEILMVKASGKTLADDLMNNLSKFHDCLCLVWFGKSTSTVLEADLQPFPILEKDGKCIMVGCGEGDFSASAKTGSSYSDVFHNITERVKPRMLKKFRGNDNDIEALVKELQDDEDTALEMLNLTPDKGSLIFLPAQGDLQHFTGTSARMKEYPWGAVFIEPETEKKTEPNTIAAASAASVARSLSSLGKALTPAVTPTTVEGRKLAPVLARKADGKEIEVKDGDIITYPPTDMTTKDQLQAFYMKPEVLGFIPINWKQRPGYVPKKLAATKTDPKASTSGAALQTASEVKDTAPKNTPTIPAPRIMSETMKKHLISNVLPEVLGPNSEAIANPATILEEDAKIPSIASQLSKVGINDWRIGHAGRCKLLAKAGVFDAGWQTFLSGLWGDHIGSIDNRDKKIVELENTVKNLKEDLAKAKPAEVKTEPTTSRSLSMLGRSKTA